MNFLQRGAVTPPDQRDDAKGSGDKRKPGSGLEEYLKQFNEEGS